MEEFKISLFESEYKINFPSYETLTVPECVKYVNIIAERYDIDISNLKDNWHPTNLSIKEQMLQKGLNC
jgi:hypothetical protein